MVARVHFRAVQRVSIERRDAIDARVCHSRFPVRSGPRSYPMRDASPSLSILVLGCVLHAGCRLLTGTGDLEVVGAATAGSGASTSGSGGVAQGGMGGK